jgi:hypothetical protein
LYTVAYPFYYERESRYTQRTTTKGKPRTVLVDTMTYDSRGQPAYRQGHLVHFVRDRNGDERRVITLPSLVDLADPAFQRVHCFWYAGRDSGASGVTIEFDVEPLTSLKTTDIAAQYYLDPERYLIRRATFRVTHPESATPSLTRETVETRYRELVPLVAVPDSVVDTSVFTDQGGAGAGQVFQPQPLTIVDQEHLIRVWNVSGVSDTTAFGIAADTGKSSAAAVATPVATADIHGRLVGPDGAPQPAARLEIVGLPIQAVTGDSGNFDLHGVPGGDQELLIRATGYRPTTVTLRVVLPAQNVALAPITVQIPTSSVVTLDPILITAQRTAAYERIGFSDRRRSHRGYFLDADDLAKMKASRLHELLARAPGYQWVRGGTVAIDDASGSPKIPEGTLRVEGDMSCQIVPQQVQPHVVGDDPTCTVCVDYYVDGHIEQFSSFGDLEARYPPANIGAIEVYGPSAAPPALVTEGNSGCGSVVIWTKRFLGI